MKLTLSQGGGAIGLGKMIPKLIPYAFKSNEQLVKFLNHPKVTASIMAGNVVALYYWLTNEWDRKDQLKTSREMLEDGSTPLASGILGGLSDDDIERIRDVFMEALSAQGEGGIDEAATMPASSEGDSESSKKPGSILDIYKKV